MGKTVLYHWHKAGTHTQHEADNQRKSG